MITTTPRMQPLAVCSGRALSCQPAAARLASNRSSTAAQQRQACCRVAAAASASAASAGSDPQPLVIPRGPQETVQQAVAACTRAWEAGIRRQRIELLLPLIGATDLDDWPGGIRQQFKAAQPMVEELLRALRELPGLGGPLRPRILDDGDAVAAWEGDALAAVLFPTGETLGEVRRIAEARPDGLVLLVNPQWSDGGNVVSDLGFLPWQRAANERLVGSFSEAYTLRQLRINSDDARLLYAHPGPWQVNLTRPDAPSQSECVARREQRPSYRELEGLLRSVPWSMSAKPLGERLRYEAQWVRRSLDPPPPPQK